MQITTQFKQTLISLGLIALTNPLELVKTRLQTTQQLVASGKITQNYQGVVDCLKKVVKMEGLKSLWKGNSIGLMRFYPNETINFSVKKSVQNLVPNTFCFNAFAGVIGGWAASTILYPFDTLRIHMTNTINAKQNFAKNIRSLLRTHGSKFFYTGFCNNLLGIALFRGTFNGVYDTIKSRNKIFDSKMLMAYISAVAAGFVCYPIDIVRRRRITINSEKGLFSFGKDILKSEGIKGLFKGGKIILPQSITGAAILLTFDNTASRKVQ